MHDITKRIDHRAMSSFVDPAKKKKKTRSKSIAQAHHRKVVLWLRCLGHLTCEFDNLNANLKYEKYFKIKRKLGTFS